MTQVLVCAGEVSGDRMAAPVVLEMRRRRPWLRFFGAGGTRLETAGVELRHRVGQLAVTGFSEALGRVPAAARMLVDLAHQIDRRRPALALLVDYPGVNLRLAWWLRHRGVPVLYYGAPQRWAWLQWRTAPLRRVDRLAVTLPFEESWFRQRGVNATFVGHPVVDLFQPMSAHKARGDLGLSDGTLVVALLPGSRDNEVRRHLPVLVDALRWLPELTPLLAAAPGCADLCRRLAPDLLQTDAEHALGAASVALCASGTATLELARAGVPGVVFYKVSPLTYALARYLVTVAAVALPNLVLQQPLLPELLQHEMQGRQLAEEVRGLLREPTRTRVVEGLRQVTERLGSPGVAGRVADLAEELLG